MFTIFYQFKFPAGKILKYTFAIDEREVILQREAVQPAPAWVKLTEKQCPHCPLDPVKHRNCPIAENISHLIEDHDLSVSHDEIEIQVTTPERVISTATSVQRGLSSMIGLLIATSTCPYTHFLKPMVRFHLPFANEEETEFRFLSTFLIAQYFQDKHSTSSFDMNALVAVYENLQVVNKHIADRIRDVTDSDAAVNAVIILDMLAKSLPYSLEEQFEELKVSFQPYLAGLK